MKQAGDVQRKDTGRLGITTIQVALTVVLYIMWWRQQGVGVFDIVNSS